MAPLKRLENLKVWVASMGEPYTRFILGRV